MKDLEERIVDNDEILNIVNEIRTVIEKDRSNNDSIKDLQKNYQVEIIKLEEALLNYMGENYLKNLKTQFPDNKWQYLTKKLAIPYEYFNSLDVYLKSVNNLKKEDFFSNFKNKCLDDEEVERTEQVIKLFKIKNVEEITQ